jgi:hypothetical protein
MNEDGAVPGTVQGTITLPDGDGNLSASAVTITSYPASLGLGATPISIPASNIFNSIFNVSAGNIINFDFLGLISGQNTALAFTKTWRGKCAPGMTFLDNFNAADCGISGVRDTDSSTLSFSPAPANIPGPLPLPPGGAAAANVPGPLPLLGVAAAFAHSRRLRTRQRAGSLPRA